MAKKVFIEPERIRRFATDLNSFRSDVVELTDRLSGNLSRLSDSWLDQEFVRFRQAFESTQQRLRRFSDEVEQTIPKLERDADAAEEIHNIVLPRD